MSDEARQATPAGAGRDARVPSAAWQTVRIGLTGPIGCGKSTVAGWLAAGARS